MHQLGQRRWSEILPMLTRALLPVLIVNAIGVREREGCGGVSLVGRGGGRGVWLALLSLDRLTNMYAHTRKHNPIPQAGVIGYMEGWTPIDVAYYAVISSTTIGKL